MNSATDKSNTQAVEKALSEMVAQGDGAAFAPRDKRSLSALIEEIEITHRELGQQITAARKVLSLIVGGLK